MNKLGLNESKQTLLTLASLLLMGYGLLLCATNRTQYYLFIKSASYPRITQGILLASTGLILLVHQYGVEKTPQKKRRPKR